VSNNDEEFRGRISSIHTWKVEEDLDFVENIKTWFFSKIWVIRKNSVKKEL
jgi:hypothetical protein